MFRFLHAADIHLDSPLRGLEQYEGAPVEEIRGATRRALENLTDFAVEEEVDFVLIAGDIYDGDWKDHQTGLYFHAMMARLQKAEIPVFLIRGNHDAANRMTRSLVLPPNVFCFSHDCPETVEHPVLNRLGVAIHGRSFAEPAEMANLAKDYPDPIPGCFNIGLLHTSLAGAEGHEPYAPCTVSDLRQKDYDYWALGHIHQRSVESEDPFIVFSGNLQGRHIREPGARGCYLVTVDDQHRIELDFRPLDVFRWERCDLDASSLERPEELLVDCTDQFERLAAMHGGIPLGIRVRVSGRTAIHAELARDPVRWTNEIRAASLNVSGGEVWVEKVQVDTRPLRSQDPSDSDDGPIGELIRYLQQLEGDDEELAELSSELEDLQSVLPTELTRGPESIDLKNVESVREWLGDVRELLLGRLSEGTG